VNNVAFARRRTRHAVRRTRGMGATQQPPVAPRWLRRRDGASAILNIKGNENRRHDVTWRDFERSLERML